MQHRTNRDGSITEVTPAFCPACSACLGAGQVHVGYDSHPRLEVRVRTWRCRTCGVVTYDEPRGQHGPTLDVGEG